MTMLRSIAERLTGRLGRSGTLPAPPPPRPFPPNGLLAFVLPIKTTSRLKASDSYFTNVASMRLRTFIPARYLVERVPVWFVSFEDFMRDPALRALGTAGAVVLCKLPATDIVRHAARLTGLLTDAAARHDGTSLYADMPDDLAAMGRALKQPCLEGYQKALGASFTFIVPTRTLGEGLAHDARRGIVVIEDPYENHARPVRVAPSSPARLLWFGTLGLINAQQLEDALGAMAASLRDLPLRLEIVTRAEVRPLVDKVTARVRAVHPACEPQFTVWSLEATEEALERCDFVIIPQDTRKDWSVGKSHNRLVAAIRGGRFALASPIPTYLELAEYAWVDEDLAAGIRWALAHPDEAAARVRAGQQYIETRFSPEVIGGKWAAALGIP